MREKWYLFKSILPDTLLLILFILLFGLLNFNVVINNSVVVIFMGLIFSDLSFMITKKIDAFQSKYVFTKTFKEGKIKNDYQLIFVIIAFKAFRILVSSLLIWVISLFFTRSVEIKALYMFLILGASIEILKTILNFLFKFDKILYDANLKRINEELVKMSDEVIMDYRTNRTLVDDMTETEKEVYDDFMTLYSLYNDFQFSKEIEDSNYVEDYRNKLEDSKKDNFDKMRELHFILLQIEKNIIKSKKEKEE